MWFCPACVAVGGEIRHSPQDTVDLLKDYVVHLRRYGVLESVAREVPAADRLTTAYLFQGIHSTRISSLSCFCCYLLFIALILHHFLYAFLLLIT